MQYAQNHYEGAIKKATSRAAANRLLKDPDGIEQYRWDNLVKGGMHFHKHPKTGIEHQLWTDEKDGTVAMQKLLGWW